jgi:hypothetical protein
MTGHLDGHHGGGGGGQFDHLDADGLAEYRAGLITGRRGRAIAAHVADCDRCTALGERLAGVSAVLAAAPVPPLPDVVAGRLDQALAAAQAQSVSPERTGVLRRRRWGRFAVGGGSGGTGGSRGPRGFSLRWVLVPVAAAAVLAVGGFGLAQLPGSPGTTAASSGVSATTGGFSGAVDGAAAGNTGRAEMHGNGQQPFGVASLAPAFEQGSRVFVVHSTLNYQPAVLDQQLAAQLAARSSMRTAPASGLVAACVRRVADGRIPVLAEVARYRGLAATVVVVLQHSGYLGKVAGPDCSATDSDIVATAVLPPGISTP